MSLSAEEKIAKIGGNGNNSQCVMLKFGMQRCAKDSFVNVSELESYSLMKLPSSSIIEVLKTLAIAVHLLLTSFKENRNAILSEKKRKKLSEKRPYLCVQPDVICTTINAIDSRFHAFVLRRLSENDKNYVH